MSLGWMSFQFIAHFIEPEICWRRERFEHALQPKQPSQKSKIGADDFGRDTAFHPTWRPKLPRHPRKHNKRVGLATTR